MKKQAYIFLAVFSMSTYSQAWAFDCTKAFLPVDFVICSSQQVMQANEIHEKAWFATQARLDIAQKKALLDDQRKWIKHYPPQCGIPAKGKLLVTISHDFQQCVIAKLSSRTEFLQNYPYSSDSYLDKTTSDSSIQSLQPIDKSENTELKERVTTEDPVVRDDLFYLQNEDKPFTGRYETYYPNGNKKGVAHIKEGKFDGLITLWDENGQNKTEKNIKNGIEMPVVDEGAKEPTNQILEEHINGEKNSLTQPYFKEDAFDEEIKELEISLLPYKTYRDKLLALLQAKDHTDKISSRGLLAPGSVFSMKMAIIIKQCELEMEIIDIKNGLKPNKNEIYKRCRVNKNKKPNKWGL